MDALEADYQAFKGAIADQTVKARCGWKLRFYAVDGGGLWPFHGAFKSSEGWVSASWGHDGKSSSGVASFDLILPKEI